MISKKIVGKMVLLQCAAILSFSAQAVHAGNVGVDVNINLGGQPRQVIARAPVYAAPVEVIRVDDDIQFVYPDALGFYVAVGVPYDLFYLQNSYFLFRDGRWLRAPSSRGPWVAQRERDLPRALRKQRIERMREYRNREYGVYNRDRDHYRGKHFRSGKEQSKEQRKDEKRFDKEQKKDDKRYDKEQRKDDKRYDKEQRKDDKRFDKEQKKDEKRYDKEQRKEEKRLDKEERR